MEVHKRRVAMRFQIRKVKKMKLRFEDPGLRQALAKIVGHEEELEKEYRTDPIFEGLDYTPYWEMLEIPLEWKNLRKLVLAEVVKKFGKKYYILSNRAEVKQTLKEYRGLEKLKRISPRQSGKIPKDMFSVILGYEDVKKLFKMSLKAKKPTHILLVGPPASAKSLFLLEAGRLPGGFYLLGGTTTKVGLIDQLFDLQPRYVLLDELDKMAGDDFTALLSLMETGLVKETKHGKQREKDKKEQRGRRHMVEKIS